ncbi:hypothetical protein KC332_g4488 [Hortaea werneckii]|nr:hypothetical protein KC350_g11435 [Hortaea werneckii]KAI6839761.1 hypothetical protein KC358_g4582 [Hortaea werneckii]KAI6912971.1 hypothetical protein KC348_g12546 [Hortaea werneckii]KAI6939246.1 hypothetical protein KC341_g4321 [Hortaea werneckii]KAI6969779.1 hypothetical protein KC321_g7689 [Hortaea werneckii]
MNSLRHLVTAGLPVLTVITSLTTSVHAQAPQNYTASCADVGCPLDDSNESLSNCQVDEDVLIGVGIDAYSSDLLDTSPTWTVGVSRFNTPADDNISGTVQRTFYLGAPTDFPSNTSELSGCAMVIVADDGGGNQTLFSGLRANENRGWIGASCGQPGENGTIGLPDECTSALRERSINAISNSGSCSNIADALNSEVIDACNPNGTANAQDGRTSFLGRPSTVYAVSLTGDDAPQPISEAQNSTSNCWPTLPQSNQLSKAFAYNITTYGDYDTFQRALQGISPLLNVWRSGDSTEFQALCSEPQFLSTRAEETSQGNDGTTLAISKLALSVALVTALFS